MPRLPFRADNDLGPSDIVSAIRTRRGGELLKMDRLMLHSPVFAGAWNAFLRTVIHDLSIPVRESQFVMSLIGIINHADYELFSHAPQFVAAGGTQAQLDALENVEAAGQDTALFSERERAIIALTDRMTRDVVIDDACFDRARAVMRDDAEMVELIGLIAAYNMVSRFVVALDVHADNGRL